MNNHTVEFGRSPMRNQHMNATILDPPKAPQFCGGGKPDHRQWIAGTGCRQLLITSARPLATYEDAGLNRQQLVSLNHSPRCAWRATEPVQLSGIDHAMVRAEPGIEI